MIIYTVAFCCLCKLRSFCKSLVHHQTNLVLLHILLRQHWGECKHIVLFIFQISEDFLPVDIWQVSSRVCVHRYLKYESERRRDLIVSQEPLDLVTIMTARGDRIRSVEFPTNEPIHIWEILEVLCDFSISHQKTYSNYIKAIQTSKKRCLTS